MLFMQYTGGLVGHVEPDEAEENVFEHIFVFLYRRQPAHRSVHHIFESAVRSKRNGGNGQVEPRENEASREILGIHFAEIAPVCFKNIFGR
jgi:hypothetical protein